MDELLWLDRAFHIFFGVLWIGLLYYFNFVQVPAMAEAAADADGPGPAAIGKYVAPRALLSVLSCVPVQLMACLLHLFSARSSRKSARSKATRRLAVRSVSTTRNRTSTRAKMPFAQALAVLTRLFNLCKRSRFNKHDFERLSEYTLLLNKLSSYCVSFE